MAIPFVFTLCQPWGGQWPRLDGVNLTSHQVHLAGSAFSIVDVLWWLLTCESKFLLPQFIHKPLPQTSLFLTSQSFSFQTTFFSQKVGDYMHHLKLCPLDNPEWGGSTATDHFQLGPPYWAIQPMNKAWPFLLYWLVARDLPAVWLYMWVEREAPVQHVGISWESGLSACASYLSPWALFMLDPIGTASILWWISSGPSWTYNLLGVKEPSSWWAVLSPRPLDVSWLGALPLPEFICMPGEAFLMVYSSPLQMIWPCSTTLLFTMWFFLEDYHNSVQYLFPPNIFKTQILLCVWPIGQGCLHHICYRCLYRSGPYSVEAGFQVPWQMVQSNILKRELSFYCLSAPNLPFITLLMMLILYLIKVFLLPACM